MNSATQDFEEYWTHVTSGMHTGTTEMKFVLRAPGLAFNENKEETPNLLYREIAEILKAAQAFALSSTERNKDRLLTTALDVMGAAISRSPSESVLRTQARFEALRSWRVGVARAKQIPPYIIATDAVLLAIASANPGYKADLAAVKGVGPAKSETYGDEILATLRSVA